MKHQPPDAVSKLKTEGSHETKLKEELPVLIIDETEKREDVETEYINKDHPYIGQADNQIDGDDEEKSPTTLREQLDTPANDRACTHVARTAGFPKSMFTFHTKGALVRVLQVNCASQRYIPASLRPRILHVFHFSLLAVHSGEREMHKNMRQHFYWPQTYIYVYITVAKFFSCTRNCRTNKKERKPRVIAPAGPIDIAALDILGFLPKTDGGFVHRGNNGPLLY